MEISNQLDSRRLFDKDSMDVSNIKLYPGKNRDTTPLQAAKQINDALSQMLAGDYEEFDADRE